MAARKPVYLREYVSDRDVGALFASSRYLIRRLVRCLEGGRIGTLVELGPGPGVAARALLKVLPADARYIAIEKNPNFLAALGSVDDPRFRAVEGDARQAREILSRLGVAAADAVIASLPFSFLTRVERAGLVANVHDFLVDGGRFVIFHQFSRLMVRPVRERFSDVDVQFEPRNLFPCFLLNCRKTTPRPSAR